MVLPMRFDDPVDAFEGATTTTGSASVRPATAAELACAAAITRGFRSSRLFATARLLGLLPLLCFLLLLALLCRLLLPGLLCLLPSLLLLSLLRPLLGLLLFLRR